MFECRHLLGLFGVAALVAGFFVFGAAQISTNWARWVFGPLLWFVGFALVVGWIVQTISRSARQDEEVETKTRAARNG